MGTTFVHGRYDGMPTIKGRRTIWDRGGCPNHPTTSLLIDEYKVRKGQPKVKYLGGGSLSDLGDLYRLDIQIATLCGHSSPRLHPIESAADVTVISMAMVNAG